MAIGDKALVGTERTTIAYSEGYIEKCFVAWYSAGCPARDRYALIFQPDELGRTPEIHAIQRWIERYHWRDRADALNLEVAKQIEKRAVEIRVEMLNRQAEIGKKLQEKGMKFLDTTEFSKAGEALKAVIAGADLERSSRGLPDSILNVAKMKDEELSSVLKRLINKASTGEDLEKALGFDIEAEFKEVPEENAPEAE